MEIKKRVANVMLLLTVIMMDLLAGAELDLFVPSFPELQLQFALSPFLVEALLSINFIAYCISLFFIGSLADRYGRKPIILIGLTVFVIGSMLCLWGSYKFLIIGRFFQGLGIAAPAVLSFLIIADFYPIKKQQYLLAMLNGIMNISVAISPIAGSYLTMYFHWQGNFIALFICGLSTLVMTLFFIPNYQLPNHSYGHSFRGYVHILQSKPLVILIAHIVCMVVPYWIFVGMSSLLYMEDLGVSLSHFGFYQGSLAFTFAIGSIIFGFTMNKYNQAKMLFVANRIFIVGFIALLLVTILNSYNPLVITLAFIPFIIGQVLPSTILYPLCINFMPKYKGRITAIIEGSRLLLTAFSLQLAGYCYQRSFRNIGIIISFFMAAAIITIFFVRKNPAIMNHTVKEDDLIVTQETLHLTSMPGVVDDVKNPKTRSNHNNDAKKQ